MKSYHEWKLKEAALDGMTGQTPATSTSQADPEPSVPGINFANNTGRARQLMNQQNTTTLGANLAAAFNQIIQENPNLAKSLLNRIIVSLKGVADDNVGVNKLKTALFNATNKLSQQWKQNR